MDNQIIENQSGELPTAGEILDLGKVLGQNQAFGLIAGRCSAAQAEGIRRVRSEKQYLRVSQNWNDFCAEHLGMSGTHADKIIRLWEEFGAGYFELAQLTRVSPETYRALEPAVENGVLTLNGDQIELTMENSRKVAAAVAKVRRSIPAVTPEELPLAGRVARLDQLCNALIDEFTAIPDLSAEAFQQYRVSLLNLYTALRRIRSQFRY